MLNTKYRFKYQFRNIIYYSIPNSILLVLKKRLNFIFLMVLCFSFGFYTMF